MSRSQKPISTDHKVFLAYSEADMEWARSFASALRERGIPVWIDDFENNPAERLPEALEVGLRDSDVFVSVVNMDRESQPTLFFEMGAAIGMNKRVVGIVPKEDPGQSQPEIRLRESLLRGSPEETADELSHVLTAA